MPSDASLPAAAPAPDADAAPAPKAEAEAALSLMINSCVDGPVEVYPQSIQLLCTAEASM